MQYRGQIVVDHNQRKNVIKQEKISSSGFDLKNLTYFNLKKEKIFESCRRKLSIYYNYIFCGYVKITQCRDVLSIHVSE